MPAAVTDKFKKLSRRWVGQIGSGGVADSSVTTIPLASTTNLPTDTAVVATIDRVDANGSATPASEETVIGVVSGSNLVSCVRGSEGTNQAHSAGAVVEILVTAKGYNDLIDGILTEHTQLGVHSIPSSSLVGDYAADTGAADAYVVTLAPVPTLVTGMKVRFKAANANTAAATLNVNSLGIKAIKKADGATALSANDIKAGQIITVIYDGTNFQMISPVATAVNTTDTQTVSNKRRTRRVVTVTQSATPTINTDNTDVASITGLAQAITSFTTNLTGTPNAGDLLEIQITDDGTARALTFGSSFEATTVALPTTTVISTKLRILFEWNSANSKWSCVATA